MDRSKTSLLVADALAVAVGRQAQLLLRLRLAKNAMVSPKPVKMIVRPGRAQPVPARQKWIIKAMPGRSRNMACAKKSACPANLTACVATVRWNR